jgi:hypothetical protein
MGRLDCDGCRVSELCGVIAKTTVLTVKIFSAD